ncbi:hypothetical protein PENTCL1PPCAC_15607, partial [Pristionchus entomophagus]
PLSMPAKGTSKQIDRECLVCGQTTRIAHLGIDTCRACSVFYRRAKNGHDYICRSSSGRCSKGKGLNCKRCRYDHIARLLKQGNTSQEIIASSSSNSPLRTFDNKLEPSTQTTFAKFTKRTELPILERLKVHYRTMCLIRLNSELHARPNPPHPQEISIETGPFYPATIGTLAIANRIVLSALLEFASCVFPEFMNLQKKEKWGLVVNNFYRFRIFEGCYRAGLIYPDKLDRKFAGFTTWMSRENMEYFYSDAESGAKSRAMEHVRYGNAKMVEIQRAREHLKRVIMCHEEFLALFAIMFWTIGDMPVREEITQIGERYREAIMKELHVHYREEKNLDDYAARIGELMMLLPVFDISHDMKEHFEVLRLLDILQEDNFTYQLQKAE